ncbi:MlaC/ttg2D family ABC transporter substrate-binding protein [Aquisalimonas asiatica]|uniref:Phospholipid transport system substrate-binding protein n=1 Tax=Aquisalimonas asiatica TaxID=406100 RepID=A0A1H8S8L7_9GAMM|nr:ABC transporter substrate-binding protein [Aquisalimonas asiatica]SEO75070.1 phospholipid transport system substrate-binding protein [Aquisalimonas asiatica]
MTETVRAWPAIFWFALLLLLPATALAEDKRPEQIVRDTTETVLEKLRNYDGDLSENPDYVYDVVREDVLPYFNFQLITRFALGRHWNDATEEQREQFTEELTTLLVRTYSQPLLEYDGEEVRFRSERVDEDRGRASMQMEVQQRDGPAIPLTYQFRRHDQHGWQVYDVVVEGISLVTNYRDTFNSEIRRNGMDGLIQRLRERNRRGETDL